MADAAEREQPPPTYYANFATSALNADELVMELRRINKPHREILRPDAGPGPFTVIPPIEPAEIMSSEPIARVVLTFTAAKALKQYLHNTLPAIEESRRTGKPL